jgi:hypothetical protein
MLVVGLLAVLAGAFVIVPASKVHEPEPQAAEPPLSSQPLRVAIVGDSLTAGGSGFLGNGLDDEAWMSYADGGGIEYVGGWARAGATPEQMAQAVEPITDVDVLVILAGTNAVRLGESVMDESAAYRRIADTIRPDQVLVSSIPPYRAHAAAAIVYNEELRALVESEGWRWIDPWTAARDGDDWAPGFSVDGIHPAGPAQYGVLGESFRRLILETQEFPSASGL